jgi:predicted Fe-Mo cluster-binding NifX family protein
MKNYRLEICMDKIIAAFATDDSISFMDRHFGEANQYAIHEINPSEAKFIRIISNTIDEDEEVHTDPNKAKNIADLLKKKKVQVLVSKKFGANINRMKKKFVCILMNDQLISESIMILQKNFNTIISEWDKGETRNFINLKHLKFNRHSIPKEKLRHMNLL